MIPIKISEEKISVINALKQYGGTQPKLVMNEGYIIVGKELFIFPVTNPKIGGYFFTEIQVPIVIGLSNTRHPYETLWNVPTLINLESVSFKSGWTIIKLKGALFGNEIQIKIQKELDIAYQNEVN